MHVLRRKKSSGPSYASLLTTPRTKRLGSRTTRSTDCPGEVSSADEDRAARIALRMRTGSVGVNGGTFFGLTSPFGGTKQSGLGRRNGEHGFEEYLEIKTIGFPGL